VVGADTSKDYVCEEVMVYEPLPYKCPGGVDAFVAGERCYQTVTPMEEKCMQVAVRDAAPASCPGCPFEVTDPNQNEEAIKLGEFLAEEMTAAVNYGVDCSLKLAEITKLESQVVAGKNHKISLRLEHDGLECENVVGADTSKDYVCEEVMVYEPLPYKCPGGVDAFVAGERCYQTVTPMEEKCMQVAVRDVAPPTCAGCPFEVTDPNQDEEAVKLGEFLAEEMTAAVNYGVDCSLKLAEITKLESQIVAGKNHKISMVLEHDGQECENVVGADTSKDYVCEEVLVYEPLPYMCPGGVDAFVAGERCYQTVTAVEEKCAQL